MRAARVSIARMVAAGGLMVEAVMLVGVAVAGAVGAVGNADVSAGTVVLQALAVAVAAALAMMAVGFARGRRWPHAPAVTWQIMQAAGALTVWSWHRGIAAGLVALAVVVTVAAVSLARRSAESAAPDHS